MFFHPLETFGLFHGRFAILGERVQCRCGGAEVVAHEKPVLELPFQLVHLIYGSFYVYGVAEPAGFPVAHDQLEYGALEPFLLDCGVGGAYRLEEVYAGLLEPDGVGSVVYDPHGVGFCVPDFDMACEALTFR